MRRVAEPQQRSRQQARQCNLSLYTTTAAAQAWRLQPGSHRVPARPQAPQVSRDGGSIGHAVQARQLLPNDATLQPRMDGLHRRWLAWRAGWAGWGRAGQGHERAWEGVVGAAGDSAAAGRRSALRTAAVSCPAIRCSSPSRTRDLANRFGSELHDF